VKLLTKKNSSRIKKLHANFFFHFYFPGGLPYPTVQNNELLNYLQSGQRLEKPEICSDSLYELMLNCWASNRDDRPNFRDICDRLDPKKNKIYIDFSELSPTYVFPPTSGPGCQN
jgi:hypothetical protein